VAPASLALAEIDSARQNWTEALAHIERSLRFNTDSLLARDLRALILRKVGRSAQAEALLSETLRMDPLDWWARHLSGEKFECDLQVRLDLAHDYARAGFLEEAVVLLAQAREEPSPCPRSLGARPMIEYTLAWLEQNRGNCNVAKEHCAKAAAASPDYCFPARLEEISILENAMRLNPRDARAPYYLGNLLYDKGRHEEAVRLWERATRLDPGYSVAWRNLGIGLFNIRKQPSRARAAYNRAFRANPADARLLFERDQLWKRMGEPPTARLKELEQWPDLVCQRDDLTVELCGLYNQTGQSHRALDLLLSRNFQPWEGGEGGPLGQYVRARLARGRAALDGGNPAAAREQFEAALSAPPNLGEAKHLLANQSDIHYWLGRALSESGDRKRAREHWKRAATFKGDFQEMSVRLFSEMTYYSALAWEALGSAVKAGKLLNELLAYGKKLQGSRASVDYFATSLPTMLLFNDDLQARQETAALFLQAQAHLGLGRKKQAKRLLEQVLKRDPNHAAAGDLARA
jgi:tetratricopeptide (TPR) repeat protein